MTNIDDIKLGGAKKKNGHKATCTCHICENMKNKAKRGGYTEEMEKKSEYLKGGYKKKMDIEKIVNVLYVKIWLILRSIKKEVKEEKQEN